MVSDYNHFKRVIPLLAILLCISARAAGQGSARRAEAVPDSVPAAGWSSRGQHVEGKPSTGRTDRLYDSIASRYADRPFTGFLYRTLFVEKPRERQGGEAVDESRLYRPFQGRRISRVDIVRRDLIGSDSSWLERSANSLHALTAEGVIRRDLLYSAGERLDADLLTRNNRNLLSRLHLSDVSTEVRADPDDTTRVIVTVITRDSWTIGLDGSVNGNGRTSAEIYDANFLGSGAKLGITNSFSWKHWDYGGLRGYMELANFMGTFFNGKIEAGRRWEDTTLGGELSRPFQYTTDYMAGASWYDRRLNTYILHLDSARMVGTRVFDTWAGGTLRIPALNASLYLSARYSRHDFDERPAVAPWLNPAFHNRDMKIVAAGLYRERFYTANLIYGYGQREYLPVGFRAEVLGGHSRGEFGSERYAGASYSAGGFGPWGYLTGSVGVGGFYGGNHRGRGTFSLRARYFSNLFRTLPHTSARQFVSFDYLHGWNRHEGECEVVTFERNEPLHSLGDAATGLNRLHLGLETVFFTPLQPLGFHLAIFAFGDAALLGFESNPLRNPFFSTVGVGVRVRNERLVFRAIEIRLGLAAGHGGWMDYRNFILTNQRRVETHSFTPAAPQIIDYR